jgi:hypothetical protein
MVFVGKKPTDMIVPHDRSRIGFPDTLHPARFAIFTPRTSLDTTCPFAVRGESTRETGGGWTSSPFAESTPG